MEWFTSDLHFGHKNILQFTNRPAETVDEMDQWIIDQWNSVVDERDDVYIVGDFSFHKSARTRDIIHELNGKLHLILGNHDKHLKAAILAQFMSVDKMHTVKIPDPEAHQGIQRIVLCHYAMRVWDHSHRGAWHLYGHSHGTLADDPNSKSFDVGIECHGRPINYAEVKEIMSKKVWKPVDHHVERE